MLPVYRINEIFNASRWLLDDERDFDEYFEELKAHYSEDELKNGYTIVSDKKGHGATRIKALPDLGRCTSDKEAMECAKKDGVKIIEDVTFVKHHRAFYLDTPENRTILKSLIQQ